MSIERKVISIALFGDVEGYGQYLPAFVRAHLNLYRQAEGWELVAYVAESALNTNQSKFLQRLASDGWLYLREEDDVPKTKAMLWRMLPVFSGVSGNPDYVFCRDLDALPMPRDRVCMEQFIRSACTVHTIHDNVAHIGIMGGLCGFRTQRFKFETGIKSWQDLVRVVDRSEVQWATHGTDQDALNAACVKPNGPSILEHRYNGWANGLPKQAPPRAAWVYPNQAWSAPIPDVGVGPNLSGDALRMADQLAAHLGSAGYDWKAAVEFWNQNGDPKIIGAIEECERGLW